MNWFIVMLLISVPSVMGGVLNWSNFLSDETPTDLANKCVDELERCAEHAANEGYCQYNRKFMMIYCRKTCDLCRQPIEPPIGPGGQGKFFWETKPWGECKEGVQERGVECFHVYEGKHYQIDLKYCREYLPNEVEPEDERRCG